MKLVYSDPKTGRSAQMELSADKATLFLNRRINEIVDASAIGLTGYKLRITGGSDKSGFPMDARISGAIKTTALKMVGASGKEKGQYRRHTVRGNVITQDTEQVNATIAEYGEIPVAQLMPEKNAGKGAQAAAPEAEEGKAKGKAKAEGS